MSFQLYLYFIYKALFIVVLVLELHWALEFSKRLTNDMHNPGLHPEMIV
jgi:hypothetical protein